MKKRLLVLMLLGVVALAEGCGKSDSANDVKSDVSSIKKSDDVFESTGFSLIKKNYGEEIGASNTDAINDYKCYSLAELSESEYADKVCYVFESSDGTKHDLRFSNVIDGTVMPSKIVFIDHVNSGNYNRYIVDTDFWQADSCESFLRNYYTSASRDDDSMLSFDEYIQKYFSVSSDSRDAVNSFGEDYIAKMDNLANSVQDTSEGFKADTIGHFSMRFKSSGYDSKPEFMTYCYYINPNTWYIDHDFDVLMFVYDDLGINVYFDDRDESQGNGKYTASFNYYSPIFDRKRFDELCTEQYGNLADYKLRIEDDSWTVNDSEISDGESIIPFEYITSYADWYDLINKYGDYGVGETYNGFVYSQTGEDEYIMITSLMFDVFASSEDKPLALVKFEGLNNVDLNKIYNLFKNEAIGRN